uniref:TSEN34 tRNA splicing endonuclease subunit n=1 Tax=Sinocyclocheilus grahami TaxID=75366 RepID=A0A672QTL4_SINGR
MDGDPAGMHLSQQSSSSMEVKEDMDTESEHQPSKDALIDISFCGSTPLLWKVSDMRRCRSVGAIGALVGSLARQPRQNVRLGRPLELLQEEALLLEDTNTAALLVHKEDLHSEAVRQYEAGLESSYKEQCALALEDKKTVLRRIMNEKENTLSRRFSKSQWLAFSASSESSLVDLLSVAPRSPRSLSRHDIDLPTKPLAPTSTGYSLTLHPPSLHSATKSAYFAFFLS